MIEIIRSLRDVAQRSRIMSTKSANTIQLIYLDQNIISSLVNQTDAELEQEIKRSKVWQVVYSPATLKEIQGITDDGYRTKFLDCLVRLKAAYLQIDAAGNGYFILKSPREIYDEFRCEDPILDQPQYAIEQFLFKLSGGRRNEDFGPVISEMNAAIETLIAAMGDFPSDCPPELEQSMRKKVNELKTIYPDVAQNLRENMATTLPIPVNFNGPMSFRQQFKISPKELNNIKPPNILSQIWEMLRERDSYLTSSTDMETFFGKGVWQYLDNGKTSQFIHVITLYNLLNTIGYYPDKKLDVERSFNSSVQDNQHAGYASYTQFVMSSDERFVRKIEAIYEYLKIAANIGWVKSVG